MTKTTMTIIIDRDNWSEDALDAEFACVLREGCRDTVGTNVNRAVGASVEG